MLHDDWTEEEVEKEVERIQKEQGIIVDTPDLRT
jgi:hypothetical protein